MSSCMQATYGICRLHSKTLRTQNQDRLYLDRAATYNTHSGHGTTRQEGPRAVSREDVVLDKRSFGKVITG